MAVVLSGNVDAVLVTGGMAHSDKLVRELKTPFRPFSVEALEMLGRLNVPAWKVGSGELGNDLLIERMMKTKKPILLSSGMSSWKEMDILVARIKAARVPLMVYQCTSRYPSKPAEVGLGLIHKMRDRYGVPAGLSDHSGKSCFWIAAAALGAPAGAGPARLLRRPACGGTPRKDHCERSEAIPS